MQRKTLQLALLIAWAVGLLASVAIFIGQVQTYRVAPAVHGFLVEAPAEKTARTQQLEQEIEKVSNKYFDAVAGFFSPWIAVVAALFLVRSASLKERMDVSLAVTAIILTVVIQALVLILNWFYLTSPAVLDSTHYLTKTFVPVITSILAAIATFAFPKEQ